MGSNKHPDKSDFVHSSHKPQILFLSHFLVCFHSTYHSENQSVLITLVNECYILKKPRASKFGRYRLLNTAYGSDSAW